MNKPSTSHLLHILESLCKSWNILFSDIESLGFVFVIGRCFFGLPIPAKVLADHDLQFKVAISSILHKWQRVYFHDQEDDLDEPSAERFPRHRGKGIKGSWLG